jgi:hypothetical protein
MTALFWIIAIGASTAVAVYLLAKKIGDNYRYNKEMVLAKVKKLCTKPRNQDETENVFYQCVFYGLEQDALEIFTNNERIDLVVKLNQYLENCRDNINQAVAETLQI